MPGKTVPKAVSPTTAYSKGFRFGLKQDARHNDNPYVARSKLDCDAAQLWQWGAEAGSNLRKLRALRDAIAAILPR